MPSSARRSQVKGTTSGAAPSPVASCGCRSVSRTFSGLLPSVADSMRPRKTGLGGGQPGMMEQETGEFAARVATDASYGGAKAGRRFGGGGGLGR